MKDTDIIAAIAPDAVSLMDKAIAEIERLRAERDEARKLWCHAMWLIGGKRPNEQAKAKGWDCFEDTIQ